MRKQTGGGSFFSPRFPNTINCARVEGVMKVQCMGHFLARCVWFFSICKSVKASSDIVRRSIYEFFVLEMLSLYLPRSPARLRLRPGHTPLQSEKRGKKSCRSCDTALLSGICPDPLHAHAKFCCTWSKGYDIVQCAQSGHALRRMPVMRVASGPPGNPRNAIARLLYSLVRVRALG